MSRSSLPEADLTPAQNCTDTAPAGSHEVWTRLRPAWDDYFMEITQVVAGRSTCLRRSVGALLVRDRHILATGYNGAPRGLPHCLEVGCLLVETRHADEEPQRHCLRAVHAEQNAIMQAAIHGIKLEPPITCYCTDQPCLNCAKMLIQVGVRRIVFGNPYPDQLAEELLMEAGVGLHEYVRTSPEGSQNGNASGREQQ